MKQRWITSIILLALFLTTLMLSLSVSRAQQIGIAPASAEETQVQSQSVDNTLPTSCALQPERQPKPLSWQERQRSLALLANLGLERFRQTSITAQTKGTATTGFAGSAYTPREEIMPIDPTNFGERYLRDVTGQPANLNPVVVLHETVGSASSAINYFRTPHPRDDDQASYHTLIKLDGTIVYLVPPDKRAFGAGNSVFVGTNGAEAVKTNIKLSASVNNFAYHISLETPPDGRNNARSHSGYTEAQYQSLAWLVARTGVPDERITTHQAVDRSGSRLDPRSFDGSKFLALLRSYPRTVEVVIQCTAPVQASL